MLGWRTGGYSVHDQVRAAGEGRGPFPFLALPR